MSIEELANDAEAHAERLARRDYHREGIEMFLALEDLTLEEQPERTVQTGESLAWAAQHVAARLLETRAQDPVRALRLALEVVAAYDFGRVGTPLGDHLDANATGSGRPPLVLASDAQSGAAQLTRALRAGRFIRSVNFHNTFAKDKGVLERQLRALRKRFKSIGVGELQALLKGEPWKGERSPILLVFYEGTRNHFDVAAPLLEELGLTGVFCLIPGFNDREVADQVRFANERYIDVNAHEYTDGRVAMTWDEVRGLAAQGHAFVCHTMTHADANHEETDLRLESTEAIGRIEGELERSISAFVWRRGAEWGVEPRADAYLQGAGIRLLISNFKVERLPVV